MSNNINSIQNTGLRYSPYSYSRLSTHEQCPRKFKYKYELKLPEEDSDRSALFKGIQIHNFLEKYPNTENVKISQEHKKIALNFVNSELGQRYFKEEILYSSLRESKAELILRNGSFEIPSESTKRRDLQFYGLIDYVNVIDYGAEKIFSIIDYKTGKYKDPKYQDYNQLMFYQIYYFLLYRELNQIRISYCYVEHLQENDLILDRKYLNNYINELKRCITSQENTAFKRNKTQLCDWCPFQKICQNDLS